ncbi:MAG: hypothetical protein ISS92_05510 [Candidatus Omnitrophica bacterium]|nr:hypothetical protein [Candidatus Omnitrophota bacterium]
MIKLDKIIIEKIIFAVLLGIFIVSFASVKKGARDEITFLRRKKTEGKSVRMEDIKEKLFKKIRKDFELAGKFYRNPLERHPEARMRRPKATAPRLGMEAMPEGGLRLEGIIWGGAENVAIISGHVVTEGETVNSARVVSITEERVVLKRNGIKIELER